MGISGDLELEFSGSLWWMEETPLQGDPPVFETTASACSSSSPDTSSFWARR
jgi:hypothetical protein